MQQKYVKIQVNLHISSVFGTSSKLSICKDRTLRGCVFQGFAVPLILDKIGCRFWICLGQSFIGSAFSVDRIIPLLEPNFETSVGFIGTPCTALLGSTYISFLSNRQCVLGQYSCYDCTQPEHNKAQKCIIHFSRLRFNVGRLANWQMGRWAFGQTGCGPAGRHSGRRAV